MGLKGILMTVFDAKAPCLTRLKKALRFQKFVSSVYVTCVAEGV